MGGRRGASPQAKAGQFGDYKPQDFLSDYSRIEPQGGDSDAYKYRVKAYSTWDYTKQAMDFWAKLICQRLDEAQGKTPKKG